MVVNKKKGLSPKNSNSMGCPHYDRNCMMVTNCCNKTYWCRICHDDEEDHIIDRFSISEMVCGFCEERQPSSNICSSCKRKMADYYCNICHLWTNTLSEIYHCEKCGHCRIGRGLGIDQFHCPKCNICIPIDTIDTHTCREKAAHSNCPICCEYMFTSRDALAIMKCGHFIHQKCLDEFLKNDYRCPICKKSMGDMTECWKKMDLQIKDIEIPVEMSNWKSMIII